VNFYFLIFRKIILQGLYYFDNVTADIGLVSKFPIGGYRWEVDIVIAEKGDKTVFCTKTGIVVNSRKGQFG
jgi:hypothetical protein